MQKSINTYIFTFNKIYLHSWHCFTSSNCIFMQLRVIVFIQLQGNDILVNYRGNKFIQRMYIYSQKVQSIEAIIFFHGIILISGKLYPFKEYKVKKVKWCIYIAPFPCNMLAWELYNDQFIPSGPECIYRRKWQPLQSGPCTLVLILPTPKGWKA